MLRKGDFWVGVIAGVGLLYGYQWYRMRKMSGGG